jgi:hypothetical protein
MINKLKSYPKRIDNKTSDLLTQTKHPRSQHPELEIHPALPTLEDGRHPRVLYCGLDTSRLELIRQRKTVNLSPCRKQLGTTQC